jgi:glycosyltransferase involved in cell wall biosynthesis
MQKIYYIAHYNGNPNQGVTKKLISQIESLNNNGADATLIFLSNSGETDSKLKSKYIDFYKCPSPPYKGLYNRLEAYLNKSRMLKRLFESFDDHDIILIRNHLPTYSFLNLMKRSKQSIFLDIPSNNIIEARIRNSKLYAILLNTFSNSIGNAASGIIGVTDEIISLNFPKLKEHIPRIAIGNATNVNSVPLNSFKLHNTNSVINFTTVAHISLWHGLDRFIRGMSIFREKDKVHFNVVGDGPELKKLKRMVHELGLEKNVSFYGFLSGVELDEIMFKTDIGIGNLGTFRKGITQTSPLKTREYCARGIPFIYTCYDCDFQAMPFAYRVTADETPIDIIEILNFFKHISSIKNYNELMREYANNNLTWDSKMKKALNFMLYNAKHNSPTDDRSLD